MEEAQPKSPEIRQKTIVGVWLMFLTPENRLFVVTNQKSKYLSQKVPGQINSPAESYEADLDFKKFKQGTISRAIREEVGHVNYNPSEIKPLGLISFRGLERKVVAAPYLIPVENTNCITYKPKDVEEGMNPQWVNLNEINKDKFLRIGPYRVPLYRSPMVEIAEMIRNYQRNRTIQVRHIGETIPQAVYQYLESDSGSRKIA